MRVDCDNFGTFASGGRKDSAISCGDRKNFSATIFGDNEDG